MAAEAPGLSHWTGWKQDWRTTKVCGQFLWTGIAHFWSGRSERVFYYVSVVAPSVEVLKAHPLHGLLSAVEFYDTAVRWAERGFLYKWKNGRKARSVRRVDWRTWSDEQA
ncbi:hypothetical protein LCGC14_1754450 [marine sediment metagenome]|uniref:Uncharacterized protein n=1 Tax=marine sediment metagenome TaxID=412755 RepID=A0A0F9I0Q1_9ZZZZ